jgi:hypothetical protein
MATNKIVPIIIDEGLLLDSLTEGGGSLLSVLEIANNSVRGRLRDFAQSPDFAAKMELAFGQGVNVSSLQAAWAAGDFTMLPQIEVRSRWDINGANGAYAAAIDTIFISEEFLNQNAGNVDAMTASVILEEIGHAVDARLNQSDSPGDEGAIFSALVRGETLSAQELAALRAEDDTATVTLDGQVVEIEQNASTNVSEIGDYTQIYQLNIPNDAAFGATGTPAYSVNNSATVFPGGINRLGYYLELDNGSGSQWVWVSMNAFTQDLTKIGVPTRASEAFWQQIVNNMNVESNVPGLVTGQGITTGNIEFWPYDYYPENTVNIPGANPNTYDFGDRSFFSDNYASMQIHNYGARQTLFAWNAWGFGGGGFGRPNDDLGIGNNTVITPDGRVNPDWTFRGNAANYTLKNLEVWVKPSTPGQLSFTSSTYSVNEDGTIINNITLIRTNGSQGQVSVTVTPSNGTATAIGILYKEIYLLRSFALLLLII